MIRCFFFFHQSRAGFLFGYILDIQRWSMLVLHSHVLLGCFFFFFLFSAAWQHSNVLSSFSSAFSCIDSYFQQMALGSLSN